MIDETSASTTRDNHESNSVDDAREISAPRSLSPKAIAEHFAAVAGSDGDPYLIDGRAGTTWRALRYRWPRYERWCGETGREPLPCGAEQARDFTRFLIDERVAPSTVQLYLSAVSTVARLRGSEFDRSLCGEYLRAARRRHGPPRRARPARSRDIAELFQHCRPDAIRDVRDAAIFALGFALAARANELVGLDLERAGSINTGCTGVVQLNADVILVRWHRTKTSQEREVELEIADADMPEARTWLARWIELAGVGPATPVIRPLTKYGTVMPARLAPASISLIIRARIEQLEIARGVTPYEARVRAARFSSHSLRRGFCTSAAEAGHPLNVIRQRSRHSDDGMVARYVGEAEGRRHSGLSGLFPTKRGDDDAER